MSDASFKRCAQCGALGDWSESKWRPFCSERCRMIDLGSWFDGAYRISEPLRPDHFADFDDESGDSRTGPSGK
ncbi:MAG: DNA gyrase inhibitor YacG [Opitutaceae bacterium]